MYEVTVSNFEKWQREYDQYHQALTWLKCVKESKLQFCWYFVVLCVANTNTRFVQ